MVEIKERHREAARAWVHEHGLGSSHESATAAATAYAEGQADREAEIAAALRRRDAWGGGAIADRETANDIERGHEPQWKNRNSAMGRDHG